MATFTARALVAAPDTNTSTVLPGKNVTFGMVQVPEAEMAAVFPACNTPLTATATVPLVTLVTRSCCFAVPEILSPAAHSTVQSSRRGQLPTTQVALPTRRMMP